MSWVMKTPSIEHKEQNNKLEEEAGIEPTYFRLWVRSTPNWAGSPPIRLNYWKSPPAAKYVKTGEKRHRDRPSKTKKALLVQSFLLLIIVLFLLIEVTKKTDQNRINYWSTKCKSWEVAHLNLISFENWTTDWIITKILLNIRICFLFSFCSSWISLKFIYIDYSIM